VRLLEGEEPARVVREHATSIEDRYDIRRSQGLLRGDCPGALCTDLSYLCTRSVARPAPTGPAEGLWHHLRVIDDIGVQRRHPRGAVISTPVAR
jgi:hypothetical protein